MISPTPVSTQWGRVTHIYVSKLTIIGSYNGLSPGRCQAIIWTNAGILLIGQLRRNFSTILIKIQASSFKNLKTPSGKCRPFCPGLNVLSNWYGTKSLYPYLDSKVHGLNMGPIWGRQDPGRPHVGPMNFVIWVAYVLCQGILLKCWGEAAVILPCSVQNFGRIRRWKSASWANEILRDFGLRRARVSEDIPCMDEWLHPL